MSPLLEELPLRMTWPQTGEIWMVTVSSGRTYVQSASSTPVAESSRVVVSPAGSIAAAPPETVCHPANTHG